MGLGRAEITFFLGEVICILFYGLFTEIKPEDSYKKSGMPAGLNITHDAWVEQQTREHLHDKYPLFQDVHVMIFIGFGFLMVFLKNNSWTSIGFNYLIAAWAIQIGILYHGFWKNVCNHYFYGPDYEWHKINLNINNLIFADFAAAAVLITFGALLGKCSIFQLWVICTIEVCIYSVNEAIIYQIWEVADIGGSMVIHTFGAYFGLACALFYQPKAAIEDKKNIGVGNYLSDLISMIGTLFLFCYWPSFNAGPAILPTQAQRAHINTYLSIACSCVASIICSKLIHGGKLEMETVLNASIAGGVGIGATADIIVRPFGAMIVGFICGAVSSFGFGYLSKILKKAINLHDTCGVHNLHGMPGIIGGITSAIVVSYGEENFGSEYYKGFFGIDGNSDSKAAGYQLAALALTLGFAISGGLITGFITSRQWFLPPKELFDDREHWADCEMEHEKLVQLEKQVAAQASMSNIQGQKTSINYVHDHDEHQDNQQQQEPLDADDE